MKQARNVAIIVALAAAVALLPGAGFAAGVLVWIVGIAFLLSLAWFASVMYREHRAEVHGLGDRMRGVLYASVAVIVLAVSGTSKLWNTGAGTLLWFALVGAASYGLYAVYRHAREY